MLAPYGKNYPIMLHVIKKCIIPLRTCQNKQMKHDVQTIVAGNCSNSCIGESFEYIAMSNCARCLIFANSARLAYLVNPA